MNISKRLANAKWLVVLAVAIGFCSIRAHADLKTVSYIDVSKYLGDWYQISHIPLWFEGGECSCARQRLGTTSTAGVISVVNTCTRSDGSPYTISGTASDDDAHSNSKFTVTFEGVSFKGTYWIIGIDPQYRYAVVSDKGADALYILSKTPTLADDLYREAVQIAAQQMDTSGLKITDQTNCSYPK